jgi:tetratricopeptide (TPR) repeat protein
LEDVAGATREFQKLQSLLDLHQANRALADCLFYFAVNQRIAGSTDDSKTLIERARLVYERVIANPVEDPADIALARLDLALIYQDRQEWQPCLGHLQQAFEYFLEIGHKRHLGTTLNGLGNVAMARHAFSDAEAYYRRAFWLAREIHDVVLEHLAIGNIQKLRENRRRLPEVSLLTVPDGHGLDEDAPPKTLDAFEVGLWWHLRGRRHEELGNIARAARCFRLAIEKKRSVAAEASVGNSLHMMGVMYAKQRDWTNARRYMLESLWIDAEETDIRGLRASLHDLGTLLVQSGDDSGQCLRRGETLLERWAQSPDAESRQHVLQAVAEMSPSRFKAHVTAALELAFRRWTLLNEYSLLPM